MPLDGWGGFAVSAMSKRRFARRPVEKLLSVRWFRAVSMIEERARRPEQNEKKKELGHAFYPNKRKCNHRQGQLE